uniref:Secreted protein n=1 Tax=Trichobilharzia regenti TaxID=157069 RepID=A0AA85JEL5_TRIRE|nr:unnamed protein product [Trichobilharzia regenti]
MLLLPTCCFSLAYLPVCGKSDIYHRRHPHPPIFLCGFILCLSPRCPLSVCRIIQSTTIRKIIADNDQPVCLTPVFASKDSVGFPLCITWHAASSCNCWMRCIIVGGSP